MTRRLCPPLAAAWLLLAALTTPAATGADPGAGAARRRLELDDMGRIEWPGEPRISPDGRRVAYAANDTIQVVELKGGNPRTITAPGSAASEPRWSHDGRWLYFLSDRTGKQQLWRLPIDAFGEATQVSTLDRGVDELNLSADESRLLLTLEGVVDLSGKAAPSAEDKAKEKPVPWVITRLHFKEDAGDGYLTSENLKHVYVYDLRTKALRPVTGGDYAETDAAWSPDGRRIAFASNREPEPDASYKTDLWLVDAETAEPGQPVRLTNDDAVKSLPQWSPDGRSLAYLSAADGVYGIQQLALLNATGGTRRMLVPGLDRWVDAYRFSPDGNWIYFRYRELGGSHLARVRVADGKMERLLEGERQVSAFDIAAGGQVAARIENMSDAPEIYAVARGRATKLTALNDAFLRGVEIGSKEKVAFRRNQEKYARLSPLTQAGKVTTPTIFLGGRDDWNVPVLNAELFYQSLRQRGVETQLVVYPKTHHGGWSEDFDKDYLLRIRRWFDKHLATTPSGSTQAATDDDRWKVTRLDTSAPRRDRRLRALLLHQ